jgi:hypothetical protein
MVMQYVLRVAFESYSCYYSTRWLSTCSTWRTFAERYEPLPNVHQLRDQVICQQRRVQERKQPKVSTALHIRKYKGSGNWGQRTRCLCVTVPNVVLKNECDVDKWTV